MNVEVADREGKMRTGKEAKNTTTQKRRGLVRIKIKKNYDVRNARKSKKKRI